LLLFALPFATATATAQETTATVTGTVTDQSGGVLPGVSVSLKQVATGRVSEGISGAEGGYLLSALPIGAYEATFTLSGFQTRTVRGIVLNVNDRARVDATLSAGGVSEIVEVTGRSLTQTTTAVQNLIDSTQGRSCRSTTAILQSWPSSPLVYRATWPTRLALACRAR